MVNVTLLSYYTSQRLTFRQIRYLQHQNISVEHFSSAKGCGVVVNLKWQNDELSQWELMGFWWYNFMSSKTMCRRTEASRKSAPFLRVKWNCKVICIFHIYWVTYTLWKSAKRKAILPKPLTSSTWGIWMKGKKDGRGIYMSVCRQQIKPDWLVRNHFFATFAPEIARTERKLCNAPQIWSDVKVHTD